MKAFFLVKRIPWGRKTIENNIKKEMRVQGEKRSFFSRKGQNILYLAILAVAIIVLAAGLFIISQKPKQVAVCGNNVCDAGENCGTCNDDCACKSGFYCSSDTHVCTKPTCGNGVCELFENPGICCKDCGCYGNDEICNEENECEVFVSRLTDEEIEDKIRQYFRSKNREDEIVSISDFAVVTYENKPAKSALIVLKDQHSQGGILLENGTLVIMEKTSVIDVWSP